MLYSQFPENGKNCSHGEAGEAAGSFQVGFMLPQTQGRCPNILLLGTQPRPQALEIQLGTVPNAVKFFCYDNDGTWLQCTDLFNCSELSKQRQKSLSSCLHERSSLLSAFSYAFVRHLVFKNCQSQNSLKLVLIRCMTLYHRHRLRHYNYLSRKGNYFLNNWRVQQTLLQLSRNNRNNVEIIPDSTKRVFQYSGNNLLENAILRSKKKILIQNNVSHGSKLKKRQQQILPVHPPESE